MGALRQATATAAPSEQASVAAAFFSITYLGGSIPVITVGLLATALPLTTAVPLFAAAIALALLTALAKPLIRSGGGVRDVLRSFAFVSRALTSASSARTDGSPSHQ